MLICLFAANYVVRIIKWPLTHARIHYSGTNQIVAVSFGTNRLGNFPLTPEQQQSLNLGTNRFVAVEVEPLVIGTNRCSAGASIPTRRRRRRAAGAD